MKHFFSIIIPAHNEEGYIAETLRHISGLDYPKDMYEAMVIENGSNDRTLEEAKKFAGGNITAMTISPRKGVSAARNEGIKLLNPRSEWVIFLDADTLLKKDFLNDCNEFLEKSKQNYTVGVTSINPSPATRTARFFFKSYDFFRWAKKVPFTIMFARKEMLEKIKFNETLSAGEDLEFVQELRKHGKCFFLWTDSAFTSTRRFEKKGWIYVFSYWMITGLIPVSRRKKFDYQVIR
jgi:glycosyltransferase involved in cell wall biosynthesis